MNLSPPMSKMKPVYYLLIISTVWSWGCLFWWKAWGSPVLPYYPNSSKCTFGSVSFSTDWQWILFATIFGNGVWFSMCWKDNNLFILVFPKLWKVFSKKMEETGSLLHQNFTLTTIVLVQILKKCNPYWQISVNTPEICAGENFCL